MRLAEAVNALASARREYMAAAEGDSGDEESDAAYDLANAAEDVIKAWDTVK